MPTNSVGQGLLAEAWGPHFSQSWPPLLLSVPCVGGLSARTSYKLTLPDS